VPPLGQPERRKIPRDPRVDIMRGAALLMIFIDHVPGNDLSWFTMHVFGFCDAAEVFVLLAGFSAMIAYGRSFSRDGTWVGLRKIAMRCLRIYAAQVGLLLVTLLVVQVWTSLAHFVPLAEAPLLNAGIRGVREGVLLRALPEYLDILPLYIVLLAIFPLIYACARLNLWLTLAGSALLWLASWHFPWLDLTSWPDNEGWYFDPFSWQFLFTIGIAHAVVLQRREALPRYGWLVALCLVFLLFAFLETAPFRIWHLPNLRLFPLEAPDKSRLNPLRLLDIEALFYVTMSSGLIRRIATSSWLRPLEACGRHSLYIFATGCALAMIARMAMRTIGFDWPMQVAVNGIGIAVQCLLALWLEQARRKKVSMEGQGAAPWAPTLSLATRIRM
jgi:hypothetical protein